MRFSQRRPGQLFKSQYIFSLQRGREMLDHLHLPLPAHLPLPGRCMQFFFPIPVTNCKPPSRFISLWADWICDARRHCSCLKEANSKTRRYDNGRRGYCRVDGKGSVWCGTHSICVLRLFCLLPSYMGGATAACRSGQPLVNQGISQWCRSVSPLVLQMVVIVILKCLPKVLPSVASSCQKLQGQVRRVIYY